MSEKDPAAVALGRKRQAKMTNEERRAFVEVGAQAAADANRKRSPVERRAIARKAAMTRRRTPKWLKENHRGDAENAEKNISGSAPGLRDSAVNSGDLTQLSRAIDELPDELLTEIASALARIGG